MALQTCAISGDFYQFLAICWPESVSTRRTSNETLLPDYDYVSSIRKNGKYDILLFIFYVPILIMYKQFDHSDHKQ